MDLIKAINIEAMAKKPPMPAIRPLDILEVTKEQLVAVLDRHGIEKYRAGQILKWVYGRQADSFDLMTDKLAKKNRRIRQLYRLMDTDLPVDYIVYRPEEVAERLSLGDPFVAGILKEGMVLHG